MSPSNPPIPPSPRWRPKASRWWQTSQAPSAPGTPVLQAEAATTTDRAMMRRALELARDAAEAGEVPVGAVVYDTKTGRVLAEARNTRQGDKDPVGHAELLAIRAAAGVVGDWRLDHCTVVVTLEPCPMCAGAIVNARLGRVIYGCDDPKAGACRSLYAITGDARLNHRPEVIAGVEHDAAAELLRSFFKRLRQQRAEHRAHQG